MDKADILVLGAGPAGMAAAQAAAIGGASVMLIDEQPTPGGQIYRSILEVPEERAAVLGEAYTEGKPLAVALGHSKVRLQTKATIWRVDEDGTITYSVGNSARQVRGRHVIIATGALERPTPLPGWTLPGVLTAGAAQILLKSSGVVPENAVLAGCGPLLYLVAIQLIRAGFPPRALVETQSLKDHLAALRFLPQAALSWREIAKGLAMLREIKAAGVRRFTGARNISIEGENQVSSIRFFSGGQRHDFDCETVLIHAGVVPNTQITRSLRLEHRWNEHQLCFHPTVNEFGVSSNPVFSVAGDGAGIGGAKAAVLRGQLTAQAALSTLGFGTAPHTKTQLANALAIRPFLDRLYQPAAQFLNPSNETLICRCEEVSAGAIRTYAKLGCTGPNQVKAFGRAGMGLCQGRYCGLTVTQILAEENQMDPQDTGAHRIRAPLKPVTLGELASLAETDVSHQ